MLLAVTPEWYLPSVVTIAGEWVFADFFFFLGFTMTDVGSYLEYNAREGETSRDLLSFDAYEYLTS